MPGYRYWRLFLTAAAYCSAQEIEMRSVIGGPDITDPSYAFASITVGSGGEPSLAFDNQSTSSWTGPPDGSGTFYIGQDFGIATNVAQIAYTASTSSIAPSAIKIQFSEDNISWITTDVYPNLAWSSGETKTFTVSTISNQHRYWRISYDTIPATLSAQEITMSATSGGSDLTNSAYTFSSPPNPMYPQGNAFDKDTSTFWGVVRDNTSLTYIGQDFGSPIAVEEFTYQPYSSSSAPTLFSIEYSDDNTVWIPTDQYFVPNPWPSSNSVQTFAVSRIIEPKILAKQYWRVLFADAVSDTFGITEVEMRPRSGGPDQTNVNFAITSSELTGNLSDQKENAFDNNVTTLWRSQSNSPKALDGEYIGQNFLAPRVVAEISILSGSDHTTNNPGTILIQYSDDGVSWGTSDVYRDLVWSDYEEKIFAVSPPGLTTITIFLKSGSSWVVPSGCIEATIECIGPGGNGGQYDSGKAGGSGGGGAYASKTAYSLTPGATVAYNVGLGGSQQATWFDNATTGVKADFGTNGTNGTSSAAGVGGKAAASVGTIRYNGGNAGTVSAALRRNGQGAGGAAGPTGVGKNGGLDSNAGGGGGGGSNGGSSTAGAAGGTSTGGNGGKSSKGVAGGARGTTSVLAKDGALGSGGGGSYSGSTDAQAAAGVGGMQPIWTQTSNGEQAGPAGGSGGSGGYSFYPPQKNATNYGAGASGTTVGSVANKGGDGIIVITYTVAGSEPTSIDLSATFIKALPTVGKPTLSVSTVPISLNPTGISTLAKISQPTISQTNSLQTSGLVVNPTVDPTELGQVHKLATLGINSKAFIGLPALVSGIAEVGDNVIKTFIGGIWVACPIKYWDGSAWVTTMPKSWDGSTW